MKYYRTFTITFMIIGSIIGALISPLFGIPQNWMTPFDCAFWGCSALDMDWFNNGG